MGYSVVLGGMLSYGLVIGGLAIGATSPVTPVLNFVDPDLASLVIIT